MRVWLVAAAAVILLAGCDREGAVEPATAAPVITEVNPSAAVAGSEIFIRGRNFGEFTNWNDVWIGGVRAEIVSAKTTELRVILPHCMPTRSAEVLVTRGILSSGTAQIQVTSAPGSTTSLAPGEMITFANASDVSCVRLAATESQTASYLVIASNSAVEKAPGAQLELISLADRGSAPVVATPRHRGRPHVNDGAAASWHRLLRDRETGLVANAKPRGSTPFTANFRVSVPSVGDRRSFSVITRTDRFAKVDATVIAVGPNAAIYLDTEVAGTLSAADMASFMSTFDDLIFPVETSIFGGVSDVDRNGRVVVLITPAVNRLTPPEEQSYVAGFFFGCDLLDVIDCSATNLGEILYAAAPDPGGLIGPKLSKARVLSVLPSVVAHEFEHLIHFNQRVLIGKANSVEAMWLTEALAQMAEDTIGGILYNRGEYEAADEYLFFNRYTAGLYLKAPERTTLVAVDGGGTLEERGAGWMFLRFLQNRFGSQVFAKLARSTAEGTVTVTNVTGAVWPQLLREWAMAMYEGKFGNFNIRAAVSSAHEGVYPLNPNKPANVDAKLQLTLPASAVAYYEMNTPPGTGMHLIMGGQAGDRIASTASPAITLLRLR